MTQSRKFAVGAGILFLAHLVASFLPTVSLRSIASDIVQLLAALLAAAACCDARRRASHYARSFWLMVASSCFLWAFAQCLSMYYFYGLKWTGPTPIASGSVWES